MKPRIDRTNLKQTVVKAGKPVKLDVNIKGEPPPKVVWIFKEKEVISFGENCLILKLTECLVLKVTEESVTIVNVDYNTKFDIKESKRAQSGIYKIVATNEHGKDEAEVEIVILGHF